MLITRQVTKNIRLEKALLAYQDVVSISHAESVLSWDQETNMPKDGITARAEALGDLAKLSQKTVLALRPKVRRVMGRDDIEKGILREFRAEIEYAEKVPVELARELAFLSSKASETWKIAKKRSNFKIFEPELTRLVEIQQEIAERLKYKSHPYNPLLDMYEYKMTVKEADKIFARLLPELKKIKNQTDMPTSHELEKLPYRISDMKKLTEELQRMLKISDTSFRSDVSEHPFMIPIDDKDIRITTNFPKRNFKNSIYDSIHEFGHAMYKLQINPRLRNTPASEEASYGIDESQSRFWENIVGHSRSFVRVLGPLIRKHLHINYSDDEIYRYLNALQEGGVIRNASNELDYDAHIALRYEIEKGMLKGTIKVSELPEVWNEMMLKYIGMKPKNDREGVLQDMHWADGSFGYFPTYTLGNIISGMVWKEIDNLDELIEQKKFDYIRGWLAENIHFHGAIYSPKVLLMKVFRDTYNPDAYVEYLEDKYLARN